VLCLYKGRTVKLVIGIQNYRNSNAVVLNQFISTTSMWHFYSQTGSRGSNLDPWVWLWDFFKV